jgi:RHS repeat-associated protein
LRFSLVNEHNTQPVYFDDFEIVHKPNADKLSVSSWAEYYAFGKVAKASCPSSGSYRYGYQGEFAEKDGETDWNSFELRQYDSEIGRFTTTDPMGEFWSSYVGMGNDPVNLTDPTGGCTNCPDPNMAKMNDAVNNWNAMQNPTILPEVTIFAPSNFVQSFESFMFGFTNAYNSNQTFGIIPRDIESAENDEAFAWGALAGDAFSLGQSLAEIEGGITAAGGGAAVALTGVGAAPGVIAVAGGSALIAKGGTVGLYTAGQIIGSVNRVHFAKHKDGGKGGFEKNKGNNHMNKQAKDAARDAKVDYESFSDWLHSYKAKAGIEHELNYNDLLKLAKQFKNER